MGLTMVTDTFFAKASKPSPGLEDVEDLASDSVCGWVPTLPLWHTLGWYSPPGDMRTERLVNDDDAMPPAQPTMKKDWTGHQSVDLRLCPLTLA